MLINEFLNNVCDKIKYKPIRNEISEELKNHIEEQKEDFIQSGIEEKLAEEKTIENMGNAEELGKRLNKIHRPKLDWKLVVLIAILISFGTLIVTIKIRNCYLGLTNPTTNMVKYIVALSVGLVLSVIIYFIDYRKISKYSIILYIIATLCFIVPYLTGFGVNLNGRIYMKIFNESILPTDIAIPLYIISFVGFIHNVNKETRIKIITKSGKNINVNIIKIITLSIISLFLVMRESISMALILGLLYMIISTIKLREKSKKYIAVLWAIPIILISLIIIMSLDNGFSEYRINRVLVSFKPDIDPEGSGWQLIARNEMIKSAKLIGEAEGTELYTRLLFEEDGYWAFISILVNYGWIVSLGMLLAIILFNVKLIKNSINIKEEYGKWLTIGISTMFILQSLLNVSMNLGFGIVAGFNLPLISYGLTSLIMNMMSLALVLSVYRRKDINICSGEHCSSV